MYGDYIKTCWFGRPLKHLALFEGASEEPLVEHDELAKCGSVLLVSSRGRFPSHFLRIVKPSEDGRQNAATFDVPDTAQYARTVVALNMAAFDQARFNDPNDFREALLEHALHIVWAYSPRDDAKAFFAQDGVGSDW